ncbi:uncharacterized protein LOC121735300 isoform X2 [Aricia agestis]|uniref:uncharacterized protein LOC121735300 isoform X2 n=1 Tax=Aricia agestis TaxID=91739 RepID=UPI001C209A29|nr:uncharacterized protein LOC121735300 isoform X2 [Aricia agestis]
MRWSEAVTLEFVKIYLDNDVLWNPSHVYYRSRKHREKAYTNIQARFKEAASKSLTIPEVKNKIKNLRTTYQQQIQKILQKSNPDSIFEPSLVWFNEMDRCLKNVSNRHSTHSMVPETFEIDPPSEMWMDRNPDNSHDDPLSAQSDDGYVESNTDLNHVMEYSSHRKIKKKKTKKQSTEYNSCNISLEDEFDIYGKYIAEQLRKMNIKRALGIQLEIQRILSEARISNFG